MDHHQMDEIERDATLSDQLNVLVERVKLMESDSELAEQRIEEQRQKSLRDVLTQLSNREAYDQRLDQEFDRWRRYGRPLSVVVGDIDHFKRVNDGYGHLAGDKVLRIIAKSLAKRLRKTDFIARYGGEEFLICLPNANEGTAMEVTDRLRVSLAENPVLLPDETPLDLGASFGLCLVSEETPLKETIQQADRALYQSKNDGRNRLTLWTAKLDHDE
jgi:diguanylate cyclase